MASEATPSAASFGRRARRWRSIALLLLPALVRADPWQALAEADLPGSLGERAGQVLASARAGDVTARAAIALRLLAEGESSRARPLLQDTVRHLPVAGGTPLQDSQRRTLAMMLVPLLLEGEGGPVDPEAGLALLAPLARQGVPAAVQAMAWYTRNLPQLPAADRLADAWQAAEQDGSFRSHAALLADPPAYPDPEPADGTGTCPAHLAGHARVLDTIRAAEAAALADPDGAQARLHAALAATLPDAGAVQDSLTLNFAATDARALLMMLAEMAGATLAFDDGLAEGALVGAFVEQAPPSLMFAQALDALGWQARCEDAMLHIGPDPQRPSAVAGQPLLLGPLRAIDPPGARDGHATGTLAWQFGSRYQGGIADGRPHGRGSLHLPGGSRLTGEFRDGLPHGEGAYLGADGQAIYQGGFLHGHRHGRGRLASLHGEGGEHVEEGRFEHGHLVEGSRPLRGSDETAVVTWRGAFQQGEPHGDGECSAGGLTYRCGFRAGDLVSVGGTGLYPRED